ncbi:MAG: hypothetical protein KIH69_009020 [Anaerolineae bacterium]|nr:hypothetical protein [Anaerolineae bacterium]
MGVSARPPQGDPNGIIYYVKGRKCGAITRVRIDRNNELSRDEDSEGFMVRKVIVDSQCYGKVDITLHFDSNYREIGREISGGEFVTHEDWAAAQAAAQAKAAQDHAESQSSNTGAT